MIEKTPGGIYHATNPITDLSKKIDDNYTQIKRSKLLGLIKEPTIYVPNDYIPKKRLSKIQASAAAVLLAVAGCTSLPKEYAVASKTKQEQVKKPKILEDYPEAVFNIEKLNTLTGSFGQSYIPENDEMQDEHILRGTTADLWQILSNKALLRIYGSDNHNNLFRYLKTNGKSNLHNTLVGAGLYFNLLDTLKDGKFKDKLFLLGVIAEASRQRYKNSAKDIEIGSGIGPSLRYANKQFRLELNSLFRQTTGEYGDGSRFKKDKNVQANINLSYKEPNTGLVFITKALWERYDEEQLGTDWHLKNEGRVGELAIAKTLINNSGIDLTAKLGGFTGNYQIGNHTNISSLGAYLELAGRFKIKPEKGNKSPFNIIYSLGLMTEKLTPNYKIKGMGKAQEHHLVYGTLKFEF